MINYESYPIEKSGRTHHVTVPHHMQALHEGRHFTVLEHAAVDTGGDISLLFTIPDGYRCHFDYKIDSSKVTRLEAYSNTTVTGGNAFKARNRNIEYGGEAVDLVRDGTVISLGDFIADITWGALGTTPKSPSSGGSSEENPFILPENNVWFFRITSLEDGNNVVVRMNFVLEKMLL